MFENFGFDPKTMTDDDLFRKQMELNTRRIQANRHARADLIAQLDILIQAIEMERRERMFMDRWAKLPQTSVALETDPDLQENQKKAEEILVKKAQPPVMTRRLVRSDKPTTPTDGTH